MNATTQESDQGVHDNSCERSATDGCRTSLAPRCGRIVLRQEANDEATGSVSAVAAKTCFTEDVTVAKKKAAAKKATKKPAKKAAKKK
ncbi:MAG: hypothetical protein SFU86_18510 [Pirellulaceae bacterium]|nr:hypothetical protein [Pirellulaceae bacterium]